MTSPFPGRLRSFTEGLYRDFPDFLNALNSFFDTVGFTTTFPPVFQKGPLLRTHAVKDNVWGMIEFDEDTRRLIDFPLVQRLRGIRQNGLTHLTYPKGPTESRYKEKFWNRFRCSSYDEQRPHGSELSAGFDSISRREMGDKGLHQSSPRSGECG